MEYQAFFADVGSGEGSRCNHTQRLDTYGCGCFHDCSYCYARAILEFRGNWHPDEPHVASLKKIEKTLDSIPAGSVIRLGGMTDCFQPCEREHRVTRETLKMMHERGIHSLIVTKSDLVAEYEDVLDEKLSHIQISVTSTSDERNAFNERAPVPSRRLRAIQRLSADGFDVCIRLSPYLPEYIDLDDLRASTDCQKVLVEFLRVNWSIKKLLEGVDLSKHVLKLGGYRHLPLKVKREYLKPILERFDEVSVCEDVYSHWTVWQHTVNANPRDCCNLRGVE